MAHIFLIVPTKGIVFVVIEFYHYFCEKAIQLDIIVKILEQGD